MAGVLEGDHVVVPEEREANQIYNKGAYGTPQSGGSLALDLVEATHLVESDRLEVRDGDGVAVGVGALVTRGTAGSPEFAIRYAVFRDLRSRGFIVKPSGEADFNLFPRGGFPGKTPASARVLARSEATPLRPGELLERAVEADRFGKRLLVAVVDEEGDITYYQAGADDPRGTVEPSDAPVEGRAVLLADRVFVFDGTLAEELHGAEFFGHPVGPSLQLSLVEAAWLARERGLAVESPRGDGAVERVDPHALGRRVDRAQDAFRRRYATYRDLKRRGLIVKTGFKFGAHFRAYKVHPDRGHAPFLVHAVPPDAGLPWPEASGFVRLAHSVRKTMLFAVAAEEGVAYLRVKRTRP